MTIKFEGNKVFDFDQKRFYLNEQATVLHCHHYTTLLTQLADDAKKFDGPKIMFAAAEESFYPILIEYFKKHNISEPESRTSIVEQYYSYIGLGLMKLDVENNSAELFHSHIDEAWQQKWTSSDKPINYLTQGFLAAAFCAITDNNTGMFNVTEVQSIACGGKTSKFIIGKSQEK